MRKRIAALVCAFFGVAASAQLPAYSPAVKLADLEAPFIAEASGIADSRENPGVLWLHNDSGDGPFLYAVDHQGKTRAVYRVKAATATDWEDMAFGPGPDGKGRYLYVGDIGDNNGKRSDCAVYRIREPKIPAGAAKTKDSAPVTTGETIRLAFEYPDGPHNAETLLCHPNTATLYVITKAKDGVCGVFRFPPEANDGKAMNHLTRVGTITLPADRFPLLTSGDISPDGRKVILRSYTDAYELTQPAGETEFESIWKQPLKPVTMPPMKQGEAVCYSADGKALYATSEKVPTPLYVLKARP